MSYSSIQLIMLKQFPWPYLRITLPGGLKASIRQLRSHCRINPDARRRRKVERDQQVMGGDQREVMLNRRRPDPFRRALTTG
jgi:hypothetical protein